MLIARIVAAAIAWALAGLAHAQALTAEEKAVGQIACSDARATRHNPSLVQPLDRELCFEAYVSSFDSSKMKDGRKTRFVGGPRWVAHEIRALTRHLPEGRARPPSWFTIPSLEPLGIAPTDASYAFSAKFRTENDDWYERGHLAAKYLAERLTPPRSRRLEGPGWYTHNVANAVPQRGAFNKKPWFTLECYSGAWANHYDIVWVVAGPVFLDDSPRWMKSDKNKKALPVAIPDGLFKIIAKKAEGGGLDVLAFFYKQVDRRYDEGPWDPLDYVESVEHIEQLTKLRFFPAAADDSFKHVVPSEIWEVEKSDFDPSCRRAAPKDEEEE